MGIMKDLHPLYLPQFKLLCEKLNDTFWRPYSGFRSIKEQQKIWDQGRARPGAIVTKSMPGCSPHNYGCATDWGYFKTDRDPWRDAPWEQLAEAAKSVGLRWGGDFRQFRDMPHVELALKVSWRRVHDIMDKGSNAIDQFIKDNLDIL